MKKNDTKLLEDFKQSYFMCIDDTEKLAKSKAIKANPGEHLNGAVISLELYVPIPEEVDSVYRLKLEYIFQVFITEDKKYQITCKNPNKNFNRPSVKVNKCKTPDIYYAIGANDAYFTEFYESSFFDFALKDCINELDIFFKKINVQFFFDQDVQKNKVILSQNLLDSVQNNFHTDINNFIDKLYKEDYDSINTLYSIDTKEIAGFRQAVKNAEKSYEYTKLKAELTENFSQAVTSKKPKI